MVQHTFDILEFQKIVDSIANYCFSPSGAELLQSQDIETDQKKWEEKTTAVFAIKKIFDDNIYLPAINLPIIETILKNVSLEGYCLECGEIADVMNYLSGTFKLRKHLLELSDKKLIKKSLDYIELTDLVNLLGHYVKTDGSFKDENVKELISIKKQVASVNKNITRIVGTLIADPYVSSCLQENNSALKENRVVLPVKENFRGKIKGIVHSSSSRGMTLFVEPVEIFDYNNEIIELEERYKQEIRRILRMLSDEIRLSIDYIWIIHEKTTYLDTIIARGRFAYFNKSVLPELCGEKFAFSLKNARHFLLGKKAVPIDLIMEAPCLALLVSGPNTGGKTVALKTAGLSVLMNQFCAGVLAAEGSVLPLFDIVLADIGDEQSISGSLSTFSGHMKNISEILEICTCNSLVLVDEPGTGTDPDEGSSLAMALFDALLEKKTVFMATTHQGAVKNYGAGSKLVKNVSVSHDSNTFKPEYKLIYGLPGESYGIDIALRNGLPQSVISKAREYLGSENVNIGKLLKQIILKEQELSERENSIATREKEEIEKRRKFSLKEISLRQKEAELRNTEKRAVNSFLRESRQKIENIVKTVIESGADEASRKETRSVLSQVESDGQLFEKLAKESAEASRKVTEDTSSLWSEEIKQGKKEGGTSLEVGTEVIIATDRFISGNFRVNTGEIVRILKKGHYLVAIGSMKMAFDEKDIKPLPANSKKKIQNKAQVLEIELNNTYKPVFELDIRGLRVEEALEKLQKQLDSALLKELNMFTIIHGYGEGVLKSVVADYLKSSLFVKKYYYAHPNSGGFGKTIVEL